MEKYSLANTQSRQDAAPALGRQYFLDFEGCDPESLRLTDAVRSAMLRAARESGATIVSDVFHQFNPHGVSGVVVIAESHLAIHTWPEHGFAAVDVFTCGVSIDVDRVRSVLRAAFRATGVSERAFARGVGIG